jgi:hypothetical protein
MLLENFRRGVDEFYSNHPSVKKIVLISYEVAIGIMLYIALRYANQAYDMGASDCNDRIKNMIDIYDKLNFTDYSNLSITGTLIQPDSFT